jgi:hypothetical protein
MTRRDQHDHPWFVWLALGVDPLTAAVLLAVERPRPEARRSAAAKPIHRTD